MDVNDQQPAGGRAWGSPRKRIVAREVPADATIVAAAAEVRDENHRAATAPLGPTELLDAAPPPARDVEAVLDPTELGERHRHARANRIYRFAQASIITSFATAVAGIAFTFFDDDRLTAQILTGVALAAAVAGVWLVRSSRLAYRLRGYAAAAGVLAVVAVGLSAFLPNAAGDEPKGVMEHPPQPTNAH